MNSCIYQGVVRHHRRAPVPHVFGYRLYMMYLDLAELETVFKRRWFWSIERWNLASFRRADHVGDPAEPLEKSVRDLVQERLGRRPEGPIRLLTHLRYFGYVMNPVSFYYCYDSTGETLEAIVAEVQNTPWNERHCYVCDPKKESAGRYIFAKDFHVSPFMGMDQQYSWRLQPPMDRLVVHMENYERQAKVFSATMSMQRHPITAGSLAGVLLRFPAITVTVIVAIYWQALRLRLKRVPFHAHPQTLVSSKGGTA